MSDVDAEPGGDQPTGRYRRQLLRNTAATGLANGWTILLSFASLPLLVRGLGPAAFGVWALLQTFSAVTGWLSLADLGVGVAATRAVAAQAAVDDDAAVGRSIATTLALGALIATTAAIVLVGAGWWVLPSAFRVPDGLRSDLRLALLPFAVQVIAEMLGSLSGSCLDGLQRIDRSRGLDALRRTLVAVSTATVAVAGGGLAAVVLAGAIASVLASTVAVTAIFRAATPGTLRVDRTTGRELLHYGRRVWLLNGTGVVHRTMDRSIVGIVLGPVAVGLVEVATQVQNGVAAVMSASSYAATSSAAWVHARNDRERLRELVLRGTKYTCLATLPLCALVAVLAPPLVDLWLTDRFRATAGLVALAVAYLATQAPLATGSNLLVGIGRAGAVLRPAIAAVLVNLVASLVLVRRYGIAGAFVATILSSLVLTPLLARAIAEATGVGVGDLFRRAVLPALAPAAAAAAAAGAVRFLSSSPVVELVVGGAVGTLAWVAGSLRWGFTAEERAEMQRLLPTGTAAADR